jgi:hypothetical protein
MDKLEGMDQGQGRVIGIAAVRAVESLVARLLVVLDEGPARVDRIGEGTADGADVAVGQVRLVGRQDAITSRQEDVGIRGVELFAQRTRGVVLASVVDDVGPRRPGLAPPCPDPASASAAVREAASRRLRALRCQVACFPPHGSDFGILATQRARRSACGKGPPEPPTTDFPFDSPFDRQRPTSAHE